RRTRSVTIFPYTTRFRSQAAQSLPELAEQVGPGAICINVTHTDVVEAIVFGSGGLHERLDPAALIIDFGTTGVPATRRFAEQVRSEEHTSQFQSRENLVC